MPLDNFETVEPLDVKQDLPETIIKVKKTRVKKDKLIPATVDEEPEEAKADDIETTRPIEVSDVLNVKPELTQREVKVMHLVKCEKCNRKMLEQTLKYKHQESCPGNKPKIPKTKDIKVENQRFGDNEPVEEINNDIDPPPMLPLKRSPPQSSLTARQNRINQKKEQFKSLILNAF